jgi:hypothetical protein
MAGQSLATARTRGRESPCPEVHAEGQSPGHSVGAFLFEDAKVHTGRPYDRYPRGHHTQRTGTASSRKRIQYYIQGAKSEERGAVATMCTSRIHAHVTQPAHTHSTTRTNKNTIWAQVEHARRSSMQTPQDVPRRSSDLGAWSGAWHVLRGHRRSRSALPAHMLLCNQKPEAVCLPACWPLVVLA